MSIDMTLKEAYIYKQLSPPSFEESDGAWQSLQGTIKRIRTPSGEFPFLGSWVLTDTEDRGIGCVDQLTKFSSHGRHGSIMLRCLRYILQ